MEFDLIKIVLYSSLCGMLYTSIEAILLFLLHFSILFEQRTV